MREALRLRAEARSIELSRLADRIYCKSRVQLTHHETVCAAEEAVRKSHEEWDQAISDAFELVFKWKSPHSSSAPRVRVELHERSAVDRLSALMPPEERARLAYRRGIDDGLRLQQNEVSADQLCEELRNDPP